MTQPSPTVHPAAGEMAAKTGTPSPAEIAEATGRVLRLAERFAARVPAPSCACPRCELRRALTDLWNMYAAVRADQ